MTKSELRLYYKNKRKQFSPFDLQRLSDTIVNTVLSNFQLADKTISIFLPIEKQLEINTYSLIEKLVSLDAKIGVPKANFETMEMKHYRWSDATSLEINEFGIPEPKEGKVLAPDRFDVVFVPLLAVDQHGNRVGYGKGFYDRFLKKCRKDCVFIGLHYFDLYPLIEDTFDGDIPLDAVVLPTGVHRFNLIKLF